MMKKAIAYSPGHITGIFMINNEVNDPLKKGSKGAGVSIKRGVFTKVSLERSYKKKIIIKINGKSTKAGTSEYVAKWYLDKLDKEYTVKIEHSVELPIGAGFGTSGAGALSLSYALNEIFGLELSDIEVAQVAHLAEIFNKTGLGTVIAEFYGGFEIRIFPGAPGIGKLIRIKIGDGYRVIALNLGKIYTSKILKSSLIKERVNKYGEKFLEKLVEKPTLDNFLYQSRSFSLKLGLASERIFKLIDRLARIGVVGSVAMLGQTVFTIVPSYRVDEVLKIFDEFREKKSRVIISSVDNFGAKFIGFED